MMTDNPMRSKVCSNKVSAALKASGHCPKVRGGNGTGPSKAEWQLIRMFPEAQWNFGIKTGKWNGSGYPPCYKVDLAFPDIKLAIEADGSSHTNWNGRKAKDRKKEKFLAGLGWTVLRLSNKTILDFKQQRFVMDSVRFTISKLKGIQATA
jgi:hypothetical protein